MFRRGIIRSLQHRIELTLLFVVLPGLAYVGATSVDVVDAVTTRPLAGVTVTVETRSSERRNVTTGSDGSAYPEDLAGGFDEFRAEAGGYVPGENRPFGSASAGRSGFVSNCGRKWLPSMRSSSSWAEPEEADPDGSAAGRFLTRDELRNAPGRGSDVVSSPMKIRF